MPRLGDFVIDLRVGGGSGIVRKINGNSLNYGTTEPQLPVAFSKVIVVPVISFFTRIYWKYKTKQTSG